MARTLSIGELARRSGVATSRLRYYDKIGLLPADLHDSAGPRRYDPQALQRVGLIKTCQNAGFSLAEIATLLDLKSGWQALARAKRAELDRRIADLQRARDTIDTALACDCADMQACYDASTGEATGEAALAPAGAAR